MNYRKSNDFNEKVKRQPNISHIFYKKRKKSELKHSIHHYSIEKSSKTTFLPEKLLLLHEKRRFLQGI